MAAAMVIAAATACASAEPASVLTAAGESATEVPTSPAAASASGRHREGEPAAGAARAASDTPSSRSRPRAATVDHRPRRVRERDATNVLPPEPSAGSSTVSSSGSSAGEAALRPPSGRTGRDGSFTLPDDRVTVYPDYTFPYGSSTDSAWPDGSLGYPDDRLRAQDDGYPYGYPGGYRSGYWGSYWGGSGDGYADRYGGAYENEYADGDAQGYGSAGSDASDSNIATGADRSGSYGSAGSDASRVRSPVPVGQSDSSSVIHPAPGTGSGGTATGAGTTTGTTGTTGATGVTGAEAGAAAGGGTGTGAGTTTGTAGAGAATGATGATVTGTGTGTLAGQTTGPEWGAPILVEDFNGTRIDESKWGVYDSPNARTNPRTARATSVSGGMLRMTGGVYGGKDLSGGVASTLLQQYGRWEVRLRTDAGAGYSAVALLMPEDVTPSNYAEVDFVEVGDIPRQLSGVFVHGSNGQRAAGSMRADFTQWHTAAVDWLPDRLTFWLDGKMVWNYTGPLVPKNRTMGLALQNDVICDGALCRNASTPATVTMDVDWVRVYRAPR
ncbi:glycoside hydrolase family 16 protein [Microtetraspora malaysiensis]|uniref:glycoside hydrolase family 16 protein n=1 Tax=Microtetraspora malaysiensis TaxID=161358 RepID=UPI003D941E8E